MVQTTGFRANLTLRQPLVPDSELLDYYCLESEKDWQRTAFLHWVEWAAKSIP